MRTKTVITLIALTIAGAAHAGPGNHGAVHGKPVFAGQSHGGHWGKIVSGIKKAVKGPRGGNVCR